MAEKYKTSDFWSSLRLVQIRTLNMPTLRRLAEVAAVGGIIVGITGHIFRILFEHKIRQTVTYKRVLEILHNHEKAVNYLGEPIKEGRIIINLSDNDIHKFSVNVKGTNTKGKLNCEYKVQPDNKTEIQKLEIKFDNLPNKTFVIHEIQYT